MSAKDKGLKLINGIRRGDSESLSSLYDDYSGALYGVILRITKSEQLAEEVLQDTFMKVWTSASLYDSRKSRLYTWLHRIAKNAAINAIQKRNEKAARKVQPLDNLVYEKEGDLDLSDETFDVPELLLKIEQKYAEVVSKIYFGGYTQKEVSDELGIPIGTVKTRVKIGLRELRKFYGLESLVLFVVLPVLTSHYAL